ncbi:MAG: RibD family protein [Pseudomonadota bacterium]
MMVRDSLWQHLLDLRRAVAAHGADIRSVYHTSEGLQTSQQEAFPTDADAWLCKTADAPDGWQQTPLLEAKLWLSTAPGFDAATRQVIELYAPLALADWVAPTSSLVFVHMAQSVDGRVSTLSGQSKWIGNEANLCHSHRLRALVDGVLVGGTTARLDLPRLDVRHATGDNPARIILSDRVSDLTELPRVSGTRTIIVGSSTRATAIACRDDFEMLVCESCDDGVDVKALLIQLRELGIRKILVEGGPKTFLAFQQAGAVDSLQLHIAPLLFGTGRPVIRLPEIDAVDDAVALRNPRYTVMGDAIMVTATLR